MTLEQAKELYPKFYGSPEKYLGIYVECIKTYMDGDCQWTKGCVIRLTLDMLHCIYEEQNKLDHYIPKFKPQEGETFIKDLEEAVNSMWFSPNIFQYQGEALGEYEFKRGNISIWVGVEDFRIRTNSYGISIDAAAYVDTLMQKGYYL